MWNGQGSNDHNKSWECSVLNTFGTTLIRHRSDTFESDRCLIDVDPRVFANWAGTSGRGCPWVPWAQLLKTDPAQEPRVTAVFTTQALHSHAGRQAHATRLTCLLFMMHRATQAIIPQIVQNAVQAAIKAPPFSDDVISPKRHSAVFTNHKHSPLGKKDTSTSASLSDIFFQPTDSLTHVRDTVV